MPHIDSGWAKVMVTVAAMAVALVFNYASMNGSIKGIEYRVSRLEIAEQQYAAREAVQDSKINEIDKRTAILMEILRRLESKIDKLAADVKELKRGRNNGSRAKR